MTEQSDKKIFDELVHLDLPLSFIKVHQDIECQKKLPWSEDEFTLSPYVCYERRNGIVHAYYGREGVNWQMEQAGKYSDEKGGLAKCKERYDKIKHIIEEERTLNKSELLEFVADIRSAGEWLTYMWWAIEYKDKKGADTENLMKLRKYTEYFAPGTISVFKKSIKNIYPEHEKHVNALTWEEVESGNIPTEDELEKRMNGYAYVDGVLFDNFDEVRRKYNIEIPSIDKSTSKLKGQVAYPGKVEGEVMVIYKREDIKHFKKGQILVASTTTPDYLPAMKKAAALVSQHGGMICHAAITSRELKIPCVVGVGGVTDILKDGDMVEVDADRGIITKL